VSLLNIKGVNMRGLTLIKMELLSIRSSDIAFTMGAKGPLLEKAYNFHGEIERY